MPSNRILIVEDSPTNLSMLASMLRGAQLEVEIALNGAEALHCIEKSPPSLILLDIQLPDVNGFDLCQTLKKKPTVCDIPIIFMTAMSGLEDKVRGLSIGAVDYITKPFQPAEVLARVRIHMEMRLLTCRVMEQAALLEQANKELQSLARLDSLTQVANRRWFDEYLKREWLRLVREKKPLSLIFCDVDCFKPFNDHYGHLRGDTCLQALAHCLEGMVQRPADLVARFGGEEFVLVLPDTDLDGAIYVAQSIQGAIAALKIPHEHSEVSRWVTLSLGVVCQIPQPQVEHLFLLAAADTPFFVPNKNGRNTYHATMA